VTAGKPHDWQYDHREFWNYLAERFQLENAIAIADTSIVLSFSKNEEDAFHFYFALLESFLELGLPWQKPENKGAREEDFATLVKRIRAAPLCSPGRLHFKAAASSWVARKKHIGIWVYKLIVTVRFSRISRLESKQQRIAPPLDPGSKS
jgi:hypothetical protein